MKSLALLALLLFVVGSAAAACGGDDGEQAALEQYFQSARSLDVAYEEQYDVFQQQLDAELAAAVEEETLESLRNNFGANLAIFTDFVDGLDDLAEPDSVRDAHNASIDALRIYLDRLQEAQEQLADAGSVSEIEAIYADAELAAAQASADETCIALQNIATK
ncbi:MAG: hypothetical protein IIB87_06900, partial [Chloroflexi bacterium]|nr:hypothetical protein [Chloroflexota bacterium]